MRYSNIFMHILIEDCDQEIIEAIIERSTELFEESELNDNFVTMRLYRYEHVDNGEKSDCTFEIITNKEVEVEEFVTIFDDYQWLYHERYVWTKSKGSMCEWDFKEAILASDQLPFLHDQVRNVTIHNWPFLSTYDVFNSSNTNIFMRVMRKVCQFFHL